VLFPIIALLELASVPIGLRLVQWNADFFNALQRVDGNAALHQIGVFGWLTLAGACRFLAARFLKQHLQLRWRQTLTEAITETWLAEKRFYTMETGADRADNPDQRIAEDCRIFVERLTQETLEIVTALVALVSYGLLLWSLSSFPLEFSLSGIPVSIPHYMVWAAPLYVLWSSGVTHWLGAPLHRLLVRQQQREADFRFALGRIREFAEPIALSRGEHAERHRLTTRFEAIAETLRAIIRRDLILGLFTRPYHQTVLQIPLFLALPAYLAGAVTLGGLMQLRSAFQNVVTNLSYFIFSYRDLADFAAASRRLALFLEQMDPTPSGPEHRIVRALPQGMNLLECRNLIISIGNGSGVIPVPDVKIRRGEHVWIEAPSGTGKSTFVRVLGGLHVAGSGEVGLVGDRMMIIPQRMYLPQGSLMEKIHFPSVPAERDLNEASILHTLGIAPPHESSTLHDKMACGQGGWSGGEQQRIALARLLAHHPELAVLDEATSALDPPTEEAVFRNLCQALPETTFIVMAHRRPQGISITHHILLTRQPQGRTGSIH